MNDAYKFDWGETVKIKDTAPVSFSPGKLGSICGIRETTEGMLYLVEFSSGEAIEILEGWLEGVIEQ